MLPLTCQYVIDCININLLRLKFFFYPLINAVMNLSPLDLVGPKVKINTICLIDEKKILEIIQISTCEYSVTIFFLWVSVYFLKIMFKTECRILVKVIRS